MAKRISCRDVGMDCDFEAQADTLEELMELLEYHAQAGHGMDEIPPEIQAKIEANIREV